MQAMEEEVASKQALVAALVAENDCLRQRQAALEAMVEQSDQNMQLLNTLKTMSLSDAGGVGSTSTAGSGGAASGGPVPQSSADSGPSGSGRTSSATSGLSYDDTTSEHSLRAGGSMERPFSAGGSGPSGSGPSGSGLSGSERNADTWPSHSGGSSGSMDARRAVPWGVPPQMADMAPISSVEDGRQLFKSVISQLTELLLEVDMPRPGGWWRAWFSMAHGWRLR